MYVYICKLDHSLRQSVAKNIYSYDLVYACNECTKYTERFKNLSLFCITNLLSINKNKTIVPKLFNVGIITCSDECLFNHA